MAHFQVVVDEFGTDELHKPSHDDTKPPVFGFAGYVVDVAKLRDLVHDFVRLKQLTLPSVDAEELITYKCDGTDIFIRNMSETGVARLHRQKRKWQKGKAVVPPKYLHTFEERIDCAKSILALLHKHKCQIIYHGMTKATPPLHNGTEQHINVFAATNLLTSLDGHFSKTEHTFSIHFDWHTKEDDRKEKQIAHFVQSVKQRAALADVPTQSNNRHSPSVQLADWVAGLCGRWLSFHASATTHRVMKVYDDRFGPAIRKLEHPLCCLR